MINCVVRRLLTSIVLLFVVTVITFGIFFLIPKAVGADPAQMYVGKPATPGAVAATRHKLGLDKPVWIQYGLFVKGIVRGRDFNNGPDVSHCPAPCFGYSFRNDQAVWPLMLDRLPVTFSLAVGAAIMWLIGGVFAGVISALRRRSIWGSSVGAVVLAGVALPNDFTGRLARRT